jgi:hypothetical protein
MSIEPDKPSRFSVLAHDDFGANQRARAFLRLGFGNVVIDRPELCVHIGRARAVCCASSVSDKDG